MNNKIIIAVIVIVVIIGGWYGLSMSQSSAGASLSSGGSLLGSTVVSGDEDSDVLKVLLDMRTIKLDDSIFQNPAFNVLKDTSQQIIPEPVGRDNPFAPVGSDEQELEVINDAQPLQGRGTQQRIIPSEIVE